MDNVCHSLLGVAVARAGLHRKTALATSTAAIAANIPDVDVLVFATSVPSVAFRRGITHGIPAQVLLPIACAALMWWIGRRRKNRELPLDFRWLLVLSYIGVLSHVFLDWLNTYGVRLLSPMSQRWFYGDAAFIVDLWLWLVLGAGALLAGRHRPRYAAVALAVAGVYVAGMLVSARAARGLVRDAWIARTGEAPHALMVGPVPLNPFRRVIILDTGDRYYEGVFRWLPTRITFGESATLKNDWLPEVAEARHDPRVRGILVWSRFPVWDIREVSEGAQVRLRDMRFLGIAHGGFTATTVVSH
jgi:inner membrane protein